MQISSQGKMFFPCPVINEEADPTNDVVAIAFLAPGTRPNGDETFYPGEWDPKSVSPVWIAQVLVGETPAVELELGDYDGYVKITDDPEVPVIGPYPLTVY